MTAYATGPCRACGYDHWGIRHARYTTKDGAERVYESRYCVICSRRRTRRNKGLAYRSRPDRWA